MSADAKMRSFYLSRRPLLAPRRMTSDVRFDALCAWLGRVLPSPMLSIEPASADASFRSYFRITLSDEQSLTQGGAAVGTLIAMDAPPSRENCRPFVAVARMLADAGVHSPAILAEALDLGFLLLSDLGTLDASSHHISTLVPRPIGAAAPSSGTWIT